MKKLSNQQKREINFYNWHKYSGLSFQEASGIWMNNLKEIIKFKNPPNENWKGIKNV